MIIKYLKLFSQNVYKNKLLTDTILENNENFDILFIPGPSLSIICQILSPISKKGEDIIRTPYHLSWIMFTRSLINGNDYLRVITYINVKLIKLCFSLRKDIFNHQDINLISFFNHSIMCVLLTFIQMISRLP